MLERCRASVDVAVSPQERPRTSDTTQTSKPKPKSRRLNAMKRAKESDWKPVVALPSLPNAKTVTLQVPTRPTDPTSTRSDEASCFISESEFDEMFSLSTSTMSCWPLGGSELCPAHLLQSDLARSQELRRQLKELRLNDFFDVHGGKRRASKGPDMPRHQATIVHYSVTIVDYSLAMSSCLSAEALQAPEPHRGCQAEPGRR